MRQKTQTKFLDLKKCLIICFTLLVALFSSFGTTTAYAYTITPANFSHAAYGSINPYTPGYKYQCSWYVWGRAYEKIGVKVSSYLSKIVYSSVTGGYTTTPSTDSIAIYMDNTGYVTHVAYVEYFDGSTVWFSEGNSWRGTGVERYYYGSLPLSSFVGSTELKNAHATVLKFVPLKAGGNVVAPPTSSVTVTSGSATDITLTNAKVMASCNKPAGTNIATCGIYLGTSQGNMTKRNTETVSSAANAKDGGKHFDMWYNLTGELGISLSPNTTYYCQFYCTVGGTEYKGNVFSFKTTGNSEIAQKIHVHVPANVTVQCYQNLGGTTNYRKFDAKSTPFYIECSKYAEYNGTNWFYVVDGAGNAMWFPDNSSYNVEYFPTSIRVETDTLEVGVGETKSVKFSVSPANYTGIVGLSGPAGNSGIASIYTNTAVDGNYLKITGLADSSGFIDARLYVATCEYGVIHSDYFKLNISDNTEPTIDLSSVQYTDETDESFTVSFKVDENYAFGEASVKVWNDSETLADASTANMTYTFQTNPNYDRVYTFKVDKTTHKNWFNEGTFNMEVLITDWKGNLTKAIISHDVKKANLPENSIIYVMDGGINHPKNPSVYTLADTNIKLYNPTKAGYTFNGWYYDSAFTKKVTTVDVTTGKAIILYAKWTKNPTSATSTAVVPSAPASTSAKAGTRSLKVTWKKVTNASGYEVQYSLKKSFASAKTKVYKSNKSSGTIKSLKSGKKYYVRVRSYKTVSGKKTYLKWSKVKSIKVK